MSTIATTNLKHPSSVTNNITLASTGAVAINGTMTGAGLDLIIRQSFSSVSSVSINNCFSSLYDNYRIVSWVQASSGTPNLFLRYRSAGIDRSATNYNYSQNYGSAANSATSANTILHASLSATINNVVWDSVSPFLPVPTCGTGLNMRSLSPLMIMMGHILYADQSNDGFTYYTDTGTLSGNISIYGYKK